MKKYIITFIIAIFAITLSQAQYKVIVNNANSTTTITKSQVSNYLLKKRTKWASGTSIAPVDLSSKSSVRKSFSKAVHRKTTAQVRAFWQQSVFSGKATPPREMKSDAEVVKFVKTNKGAIGYVSAGANTAGVKVISVK